MFGILGRGITIPSTLLDSFAENMQSLGRYGLDQY
jgi:hypothetical protein